MGTNLALALVGQFKKSEATDSDTFIESFAVTLAQYPVAVAKFVCHPLTGLATAGPWVPSVFELREACNARMRTLIAQHHYDKMSPEKKAKMANLGRETQTRMELEGPRPTEAELRAKYGQNWGLGGDDVVTPLKSDYTVPTLGQITEHYRTHGLQFKPKPITERDYHEQDEHEGVMADDAAPRRAGEVAPQGGRVTRSRIEAAPGRAPGGNQEDDGEESAKEKDTFGHGY